MERYPMFDANLFKKQGPLERRIAELEAQLEQADEIMLEQRRLIDVLTAGQLPADNDVYN